MMSVMFPFYQNFSIGSSLKLRQPEVASMTTDGAYDGEAACGAVAAIVIAPWSTAIPD
jgi:hypothetical protein